MCVFVFNLDHSNSQQKDQFPVPVPGWEIVLHARNYLSPFSQGPCEPAGVKTEAGVSKGRKKGDKKRYMYESNLGPGITEKAKVHLSYSLHPLFLLKAIDLFTERDFLAFLSQLRAGVDEDQSWKMFLLLKLKLNNNIKVPQLKTFIWCKEYFGCERVVRECKQKAITVTETTIRHCLLPAIWGDAFWQESDSE